MQRKDQRRDPLSVYIVAEAVSDASPFWFKYVLDLAPSQDGRTNIRWIRVAPYGNSCPGVTVKAMTAVVGDTVASLVKPNLCALPEAAIKSALARSTRQSSIWDTVGFGLVAQCGVSKREFHLPLSDLMDSKRLKRESRDAAAMYDTYSRILRAVFPKKSFYGITTEQDLELQRQGSLFIPELASGKFDGGLSEGTLAGILRDYRGIHEDGQEPHTSIEVVSPNNDAFDRYVKPTYPRLAIAARVQGSVELSLDVDEAGKVRDVVSVRANRLLQESARQAAMEWQFRITSQANRQVSVVLTYVIGGGCE